MKNTQKILLLALVVITCLPFLNSCKQGDGDPWFSIYSRKNRLCNNWKVASLEQTFQYKTTTVTTTFDGNKKRVETYVPDTVVYTPTDTLYEYRYVQTYTGTLNYTFETSGTYQIDEAFTDDTTGIKYTSQENGYWYFTGGNDNNDTKSKELLGLQPNKYVYNPLDPSTYTFTYSGENGMYVYHIYALGSKEVELRADVEETTNLFATTSTLKIVLKPR